MNLFLPYKKNRFEGHDYRNEIPTTYIVEISIVTTA